MMMTLANPSRALLSMSSRGPSLHQSHAHCVASVSVNRPPGVTLAHAPAASVSLSFAPLLNHRRSKFGSRHPKNTISCMLGGGKDFSGDDSKGFSWNPIGESMGSSGGKSIEDVLREQIEKKEYYDGGNGKKPPRFLRFFGFGGNHGDGSGGSGNGSLGDHLDDIVQGFVALVAFVLMYVFFLSGPEIILLLSDYIKYLCGRRPSVRLKKELNKWGLIYQGLTSRLNPNEHWLEMAILSTTTWFDSPDKYWTHRPEELRELGGESAPDSLPEFEYRRVDESADSDDDGDDPSDDEN